MVAVTTDAWRGTGPRPTVKGTVCYRSAGACPPRSPACPSDCSSGSPDPERVKIARSCPTETRQITCPPRSTDLGEKRPQPRDHGGMLSRPTHGEGNPLGCACGMREAPRYGNIETRRSLLPGKTSRYETRSGYLRKTLFPAREESLCHKLVKLPEMLLRCLLKKGAHCQDERIAEAVRASDLG